MRTLAIATLTFAFLASNTFAAGPPDFPRLRSLFERKKKDDEAPTKVKQLLETLKTDTDEKKRKAAAEGLGENDPRGNPELMTGLITSLRQDPAISVRTAAADSIGKLKPVSAQAGVALEDAVQADPSDEVRKAAQGALFQYHLNGYKATFRRQPCNRGRRAATWQGRWHRRQPAYTSNGPDKSARVVAHHRRARTVRVRSVTGTASGETEGSFDPSRGFGGSADSD